MTPVAGYLTRIYVGGVDLTAYFNSADSSQTVAKLETTVFSNTAKMFIPGQLEGGLKASGLYKGLATDANAILETYLQRNGGQAAMFGPGGDTVGKSAWIGLSRTLKHDVKSAVGGLVATELEMVGSGGVAWGVFLHALAAETATGTGTAVDGGAASSTGWRAALIVPTVTGTTPNGTFKIQDSADNSTFADVATFTVLTAASADGEVLFSASGATLRRYVRVIWTLTGTSPSFTFAAAIARH